MGDHPEVCETLLRDYATVNMKDQHQWTELHHACKYGYTKHVDLLLKFKADISAKNNVGNTPLHVSASHGQVCCYTVVHGFMVQVYSYVILYVTHYYVLYIMYCIPCGT